MERAEVDGQTASAKPEPNPQRDQNREQRKITKRTGANRQMR